MSCYKMVLFNVQTYFTFGCRAWFYNISAVLFSYIKRNKNILVCHLPCKPSSASRHQRSLLKDEVLGPDNFYGSHWKCGEVRLSQLELYSVRYDHYPYYYPDKWHNHHLLQEVSTIAVKFIP